MGFQTGYRVETEPGKTSWREASLHCVLLGQGSQVVWREGIVSRGSSIRKTKVNERKAFLASLRSCKEPSVP